MSDTVALSEPVANIAKQVQLNDGVPMLSDADLNNALGCLKVLPQEQRRSVSEELLALAIKYNRGAGEAAAKAVAQIFILVAFVMDDWKAAQELFASQGIDLSKSAKFIDAEVNKRPVETSPLTQGQNLFALLKSKK